VPFNGPSSVFFFKKKKAARSPKLLVQSSPQKRSAFRMPVEFAIEYTLEGRSGARSAVANDLSAGGLRLLCDEDFLKGSMLLLEFKLPDEFLASMTVEKELYEQTPFGLRPETIKTHPHGFAPMALHAKVLGTFLDMTRKKLAHGLAFIDIDTKTEDEIQRFIHLWQIHYLRMRHGD
jgi:hypothetical protein